MLPSCHFLCFPHFSSSLQDGFRRHGAVATRSYQVIFFCFDNGRVEGFQHAACGKFSSEKDCLQISVPYMAVLLFMEVHNAGGGDYHIRTNDNKKV